MSFCICVAIELNLSRKAAALLAVASAFTFKLSDIETFLQDRIATQPRFQAVADRVQNPPIQPPAVKQEAIPHILIHIHALHILPEALQLISPPPISLTLRAHCPPMAPVTMSDLCPVALFPHRPSARLGLTLTAQLEGGGTATMAQLKLHDSPDTIPRGAAVPSLFSSSQLLLEMPGVDTPVGMVDVSVLGGYEDIFEYEEEYRQMREPEIVLRLPARAEGARSAGTQTSKKDLQPKKKKRSVSREKKMKAAAAEASAAESVAAAEKEKTTPRVAQFDLVSQIIRVVIRTKKGVSGDPSSIIPSSSNIYAVFSLQPLEKLAGAIQFPLRPPFLPSDIRNPASSRSLPVPVLSDYPSSVDLGLVVSRRLDAAGDVLEWLRKGSMSISLFTIDSERKKRILGTLSVFVGSLLSGGVLEGWFEATNVPEQLEVSVFARAQLQRVDTSTKSGADSTSANAGNWAATNATLASPPTSLPVGWDTRIPPPPRIISVRVEAVRGIEMENLTAVFRAGGTKDATTPVASVGLDSSDRPKLMSGCQVQWIDNKPLHLRLLSGPSGRELGRTLIDVSLLPALQRQGTPLRGWHHLLSPDSAVGDQTTSTGQILLRVELQSPLQPSSYSVPRTLVRDELVSPGTRAMVRDLEHVRQPTSRGLTVVSPTIIHRTVDPHVSTLLGAAHAGAARAEALLGQAAVQVSPPFSRRDHDRMTSRSTISMIGRDLL
eukprot:gnl/Dysnectes_brevis/5914_a8799_362.p1 GENE.gnl/Dysnectes_brevis/5914_a8799_362~~gnl/Dysnectes_brevis/5914_a8799_362.p1  ORF type:complete len:719 (+),score=116.68 gnl/Dysnectes_brevis/5914_a8799_362:156-2312(+)